MFMFHPKIAQASRVPPRWLIVDWRDSVNCFRHHIPHRIYNVHANFRAVGRINDRRRHRYSPDMPVRLRSAGHGFRINNTMTRFRDFNFFQFTQRQVNASASPLNLSLVAVWFIGISWQFPAHIPPLLTIVHLHRLYWCCCCRVASSSSFYPQRDQRRVLMQVSLCFIYAHNCTAWAFLWAPDRFNALADAKFSSGDFPFVVLTLLGWMARERRYTAAKLHFVCQPTKRGWCESYLLRNKVLLLCKKYLYVAGAALLCSTNSNPRVLIWAMVQFA